MESYQNNRKKVLIVSPQASRIGHGAFHGQRTLAAFAEFGEWDTIFLTGKGFRERVAGWPLYGEVIEAPIDLSSIGAYHGVIQSLTWGVRRRWLQDRLLQEVDRAIVERNVDAVFVLDGDVSAIYRCWLRNRRSHPDVAWVIAHNMIDFYFSNLSIRSLYKWWVASEVRYMTQEMGATILYVGQNICNEYCRRLNVTQDARERIILTRFGSDSDDMRLPLSEARSNLNIPVNAKVALFFGMIRADKRPDVAIRAVSQGDEDWWLLLAGKPYSYSEEVIRSWVGKAGLEDRSCLILRYLDEDEVRVVFSAADVLLLTHERSTVSNSGPLSMARSYRLPVIVSDVGFLGESVRQDRVGFAAQAGAPFSFAEQLRNLESLSMSEIEALRGHIQKAAYKYSFASTVRDYSRALEIALTHTCGV